MVDGHVNLLLILIRQMAALVRRRALAEVCTVSEILFFLNEITVNLDILIDMLVHFVM